MNNEPIDTSKYMNNSLLVRFCDVLYRKVFQPVLDLYDRLDAKYTTRMVDSELKYIASKEDN